MLRGAEVRRIRRLAAGFCLTAAPLVLLAGAAIHPQVHYDLAVVSKNPDRYFAAHAILLTGLVLFLPAVLALVHMLKGRQAAIGHAACGLAIIGMFGAAGIVTTDGVAVSQMGQPEANSQEMAALLDRIKESNGLRAIARGSGVSFMTGMILLAYSLWSARAAPPWVAAGIVAAAITLFVAYVTDNRAIFVLAFALYAVGFVPLGVRTLAQSDDEWATPSATLTEPVAAGLRV